MHVRQLLDTKAKNFIETVSEMQTLSDVVRRLAELKIGAVVVTDGDGGVTGTSCTCASFSRCRGGVILWTCRGFCT